MIRVENISRSFGDLKAVDSVSFEVSRGEIVGLLGPNGAGKTTTLRMLATLLRPDEGTVEIDGHDVGDEPRAVRASIGYQTGDTGLYARLTPVEFLRYFGRLHSIPSDELEPRIDALVDDFEIRPFAEQRCGELSTGQKQRVSVARAMLHNPSTLILDEPTAGLDLLSSDFVLQSLVKARNDQRAVLFSTHIMSEVELICDRVLVMHRGRIIARGTVAELLGETDTSQLSRAFLSLVASADSDNRAGNPEQPSASKTAEDAA